jgi:hypothetical protein
VAQNYETNQILIFTLVLVDKCRTNSKGALVHMYPKFCTNRPLSVKDSFYNQYLDLSNIVPQHISNLPLNPGAQSMQEPFLERS